MEVVMEQKNTWETYDAKQLAEVDCFAREYMDFLDNGKTERECIDQIVNTVERAGYQELEHEYPGSPYRFPSSGCETESDV